jgi:GTP-binding protein Era
MLIDASMPLGPGDKFIIERLDKVEKPVILIINKIDKLTKDELLQKIAEYKDLYDFKEIIPVSALKKDNVDEVVKVLKEYLPDSVQYYGENDITNKSTEFLIGEIIREKVFELTEEEVPHSLTCYVEHVEKKKGNYVINGVIVVDRDSLKKIIIGKQGTKIKEIGIKARKDLEELLQKKVYLELYVKVIKKWRDKEKYLQEFGFNEFE